MPAIPSNSLVFACCACTHDVSVAGGDTSDVLEAARGASQSCSSSDPRSRLLLRGAAGVWGRQWQGQGRTSSARKEKSEKRIPSPKACHSAWPRTRAPDAGQRTPHRPADAL